MPALLRPDGAQMTLTDQRLNGVVQLLLWFIPLEILIPI
jgi:hypothetical protein